MQKFKSQQMPEGILIIFNLATLKLSEIDNISVKNVKHVKLPVNLLFPVEVVAELPFKK